jgi:hypothetical protein
VGCWYCQSVSLSSIARHGPTSSSSAEAAAGRVVPLDIGVEESSCLPRALLAQRLYSPHQPLSGLLGHLSQNRHHFTLLACQWLLRAASGIDPSTAGSTAGGAGKRHPFVLISPLSAVWRSFRKAQVGGSSPPGGFGRSTRRTAFLAPKERSAGVARSVHGQTKIERLSAVARGFALQSRGVSRGLIGLIVPAIGARRRDAFARVVGRVDRGQTVQRAGQIVHAEAGVDVHREPGVRVPGEFLRLLHRRPRLHQQRDVRRPERVEVHPAAL